MYKLYAVFILYLCAYSAYSSSLPEIDKNNTVFVIEKGLWEQTKDLYNQVMSIIEDKVVEPTINATREISFMAFDQPTNRTEPESVVRNRRDAYAGYGGPQQQPVYQQQGYRQQPLAQQPMQPHLGHQIVDGGLGAAFPDFYDFYPNDFLYDYYDWVCSDSTCQLCNILTSECCDPEVNVNCFLPDSCLNNPCLSGGTCIPTRTIDDRPDFICACYPGFTGKYCQLTNEFFFPPPPPPILPPPVQQPQPQYQQPVYQAPVQQQPILRQQPQYQAPVQQPVLRQQPQYQAPVQQPVLKQQPQYQAPVQQQQPILKQQSQYNNNNGGLQQSAGIPRTQSVAAVVPQTINVARLPQGNTLPTQGRGPSGVLPQQQPSATARLVNNLEDATQPRL